MMALIGVTVIWHCNPHHHHEFYLKTPFKTPKVFTNATKKYISQNTKSQYNHIINLMM